MTHKTKELKFFCTANSPDGFLNNFHQFFKYDKNSHCYIIKAGAGCGKSTLMKNIATYLSKKGYNVFLLNCTSDPSSLDGVYCKELNFIIVDGTSPHLSLIHI